MREPAGAVKQVMGPVEWGLLLLLGAIWGGSYFFAKIAVGELPPFTVVLVRVGLAALALNLIVRLSGRRMPTDPGMWRALLVMGLVNSVIPFSLIFWGQTQIAAGLASILNATTPLFTVLVAHVATSDEKMTPPRLLGLLIGLGGVAVMIGPGILADAGGDTLAKLAVVGAAVAYAVSAIWGRRFRGMPPMVIAAGQMTAATGLMIPLTILADRPWTLPMPSGGVVLAVLALALGSTAVGYLLFYAILGRAGATNVTLVTLLIPPNAVLLGALFLGERLGPRDLLGLAFIALGLAAIDGRILRWAWGRFRPRRAVPEWR